MVPWFCVCVYVLITERQVGEAYNKEEKNALIFQDERVHERILFLEIARTRHRMNKSFA